jgi:hypothetical protein
MLDSRESRLKSNRFVTAILAERYVVVSEEVTRRQAMRDGKDAMSMCPMMKQTSGR